MNIPNTIPAYANWYGVALDSEKHAVEEQPIAHHTTPVAEEILEGSSIIEHSDVVENFLANSKNV